MLNQGLKLAFSRAAFAVAFFSILVFSIPVNMLIILLNGVFAGACTALVVAFYPLVRDSILGQARFDRVRQMTAGFFLCWIAYILSTYTSVYMRAADLQVTSSYLTAASRYIAIIAAVLQATAPDFGLGLFHGRERKTLWTGMSLGAGVAIFVVLAQTNTILASR